MIRSKTVAVVVPAYNEENQIGLVLESMPDFVDRIIVVNDCSTDKTEEVALSYINKIGQSALPIKENPKVNTFYNKANEIVAQFNREEIKYFAPSTVIHNNPNDRLVIISLLKNSGVGGAIARGYKWAKDNNIDCTAVMAGDGQMDPDELYSICEPVINESVDFVKGNRLWHKSARFLMPKKRYIGNSILSILTKVASGYWRVSDTQTGFTAMSNRALNKIDLYKIYPRYGMPNDILVKLNIENCSIKEVEIKPIYFIGETSKMRIGKVIPKISWLLTKSFFKRIWIKYLKRSFHPLFVLYHLGLLLILLSIPFGIKILVKVFNQIDANPVTVLAFALLFISGFQFLLFAMWMDIQDNERLYKD
ncbi:glycosyltransferase family 2 protein [Tenuifilum thalassicum]|uniref:Glycosyltransferase family 2 protein n=1 Tax=Tenuifilum thalassicum TaxID=2590900 RepID=A0A7D3XLW4_9BACT|nr:glycosyltransferase family 2 protein [Tenuifilum thalassicum]QKG80670.1 glycosyltransferase family 2 protein [Tenuifilum thalassicum]